MDCETTYRSFARCSPRLSQSLCNVGCQNILYKSVLEYFHDFPSVAAILLTSKSFQNSSFGANFLVHFSIDLYSVVLLDVVLAPSSCWSLQFVPSLHIETSEAMLIKGNISNFVGALVDSKYLRLQLRSLTLTNTNSTRLPNVFNIVDRFFGSGVLWPQLRSLSLSSLDLLDDAVVAVICKSTPHLVSLNLRNCQKISDLSLEHISKLTNITSINLCRCKLITDDGLVHISTLPSITSLDFSYCNKITDAGLEHISNLFNIISLNLSYCYLITDDALRRLCHLPSITFLDLCYCDLISDEGLEHISKLSGITSLNLYNLKKITDAGLEQVAKFSNITSLDLSYCNKITDVGLQQVSKLCALTTLNVCNCNFTFGAKMNLRTALPKCKMFEGR